MWDCTDNQDVGLEDHSFKECVIAHWSSDPAPKISGLKLTTEATASVMMGRGLPIRVEA